MQVVKNLTNVFTGADNGSTVTLSPDTYATVRLSENPSTGYSWNVSTTEGLLIVGDLFIENETGLVGGVEPRSGSSERWKREERHSRPCINGHGRTPPAPKTGLSST